MNVKINGKQELLEGADNLFNLVEKKGLNAERIVIEHNYKVVTKEKWSLVTLNENDNIEIVSFVGGG
jgi:sulfur carrier protein